MTGTAVPRSGRVTSDAPRLSTLIETLRPSLILTVAAETREAMMSGRPVCNLTVGDFDPKQFPVPERLARRLSELVRTQTNYPPSSGMPELRAAVPAFYREWLGLDYTDANVLICAGGRPIIYGAYRVLVNPGDKVLYPTPSWSNEYYAPIVGGVPVEVPCGRESGFLATAEKLAPHLADARLLILCSPMNPAGTLFTEPQLAGICDAVVAENARRRASGARPLYLLFDQMYWMLTFGGAKHYTPVGLRPELKDVTVFVDGISKSFAATGLRVGWAVGPTDVIKAMSDLLTHVGAWAPRAEQLATAELLGQTEEIRAFHRVMLPGLEQRLTLMADGIAALKRDGFPVDSTPPRGSIYLSAQFHLNGRHTPEGEVMHTNDDVRRYLLRSCGLAGVPFQAFGTREETGWFRLSAGAVSPDDIRALLPRLRAALEAVKP
ncbi:MAG TPA: aminotransferase class I/II-fold pyridoxal phosphate-dependent enzyme [Gemmatimonadaceae bacterium]|nr:aminotransferase class I/II-fold pyridoxal phosphate-dependent enzyme [Gemmatimonadaceae bacterium]